MPKEQNDPSVNPNDPGAAKKRQSVETMMALQRLYGAAQSAPLPKSAHIALEADANLLMNAIRGETITAPLDVPPDVPVSAVAPTTAPSMPPKHRASGRPHRKGAHRGKK